MYCTVQTVQYVFSFHQEKITQKNKPALLKKPNKMSNLKVIVTHMSHKDIYCMLQFSFTKIYKLTTVLYKACKRYKINRTCCIQYTVHCTVSYDETTLKK